MKQISIIIPVYNVAKYLEKCINSTYNQELTENEFEIIAVDDESPDDSLQVLNEIKKNHFNIRVISQKNKGLGGARNTGLLNASGEYILFLDADDYYIENSLKEIYTIAKDSSLDILEFGAQGVDISEKIVYETAISNNYTIQSGIHHYNNLKYMNSACNKLYKRSFLEENKLFFVEKIYGEDFEFNTRALYLAKRTMAISNIVAKFLQSEESITRSNDIEKKRKYANDFIDILQRIDSFRLNFENDKSEGHDQFFNERMSILNVDLFYITFKNNFPISEILTLKDILKSKGVFRTNYSISDKKKNLFRMVFLNFNFLFFRTALMLKKTFKI
ncbi:glycosyltransferase family 2 protein [Mariniflexile gromovii]|uniref:Glycosyltransferase family 2 protein n=1 Tax=Mariniflexile gromovii TaxID=362523 RepID=A0ABS4BPF9_9FLAO|nr:glycosyltransferase family 2 protein [Mariniflexile gromovii]MBP0902475.1 glycosyltransferase family 2 protein [Mariniflexile gromovii]